ncbi:MAG TPA: SDR family oxidoreductase [Mycobacteriales bacterium]|nr:SDR family oxidoreductase [Mycobacteriales bacterium]
MNLELRDRVYVIAGGSRGLGRATAQVLVADGARVVISSRDPAGVEATVSALGGPEHATGVAADNADPATAGRLVDLARTSFGRLDGALISVGGPPPGSGMDVADGAWREAFESVFLGAVRLVRTVAAGLDTGGAIGLVLSSSVKSPIGGLAVSNGFRPGLAMLAKDFADELGPRGIRVLSLAPGRIATDRTMAMDGDDPATRTAMEARIPLRRYGEPAEFGRVAAFCLSPAASYLSGCVVTVDGGSTRAL